MKRKIIILVALIGIALVGMGIFFLIGKKGVEIASVLPSGPVAYLQFKDVSKNMEKFQETQLWKGLQQVPWSSTLIKVGGDPKALADYQNFQNQLFSPDNKKIFDKLFGKEVVLAIYPINVEEAIGSDISKILSHIVIVTRVGAQVQMAEALSRFAGQSQEKFAPKSEDYQGHTIWTVTSPEGFQIGYVRIKDLLIISWGTDAARQAIDVVVGKKLSLVKEKAYAANVQGALTKSGMTGYANFEVLANELEMQITRLATKENNPQEILKPFQDSLKRVKGFQSLGYSVRFDKVAQIKVDLYIDKNLLDPNLKLAYECPAQKNATFEFVPDNILAYQWSGCYDLDLYWKQIKEDLERQAIQPASSADGSQESASAQQVIEQIENNLGLKIETDILPALGDELGGYLVDIQTDQMIPLPQFVFFIKIKDQAKAQHVLDALIARQPLFQLSTENYRNQSIQYINMPLIPNFSPSYTFLKDYLLVGINLQVLHDALDTLAKEKGALVSAQSFRDVNFGLTEENNSLLFIEVAKMALKADRLIDWVNQWMSAQVAKQSAVQSGSQQRVQDVRKDIATAENHLGELRTQLRTIKDALKSGSEVDTSQVLPLSKQIAEAEKDVERLKQTEKDLLEMVASYDKEAGVVERRQILLNELARPFLKALTAVKSFSSKVVIQPDHVEILNYLKVE
ncbi:MAG: DUF3352 domain-containing protein [Candidatus Omnitrophica bacterium]|nr:DUF3352 domain-containing protein [Candidatus Omnitrophota bacterium]